MASVVKSLWGIVLLVLLVLVPPAIGFYLIGLILRWGGFQGFNIKLAFACGVAIGIFTLFYMLEMIIIKVIKRAWKKTMLPYS